VARGRQAAQVREFESTLLGDAMRVVKRLRVCSGLGVL